MSYNNPTWYKANETKARMVLCRGCKTHYTVTYGGPCPKCGRTVCNICQSYGCDKGCDKGWTPTKK